MNQPSSLSLLFPEIKELLNEKNYVLLRQVMREYNPLDFADVWRRFTEEERLQIFKLLPTTSALKVFEILDIEDQKSLLARLSEDSVTPILEAMDSPDLAKIFHKMSPRAVKKMTSLIKRQEALAHIDTVMKFPENTVGCRMHPEFVKLTPKITAKQSLALLQAITRPNQKEHLTSLFVTDEQGKVLGGLTLQDLVTAPEDEKLSELMSSVEAIKLKPEMDQEDAAKLFSKYQINAAPVVDDASRLIGILTAGDIISIIRQEATEDITKMAGTQAADIRERSTLKIVALRMPWLFVTLLGGFAISLVVKNFEPLLMRVIALASFAPLIAGMGGNVGSQSAIVMVRNIALGHVNGHQKVHSIFREMRVGLLLGVTYGLLLGAAAYLLYGSRFHLSFSVVVAIGMCVSMTVAATLGAVGPILLNRFGIDPATATGPLITTLTDIVTMSTYLTLATLLLAKF